MEQQLIDWIDYCEGNKDFDKSHFYTLFLEGEGEDGQRSTQELKTIFSYFPHAEGLRERLENVLNAPLEIDNIKEHLLKFTRLDLNEKKKILQDNGQHELLRSIETGVKYIGSSEEIVENRIEDGLYSEFLSEIDFYATEKWIGDDDKYYALFEAFYGLVNDYQLSWYLGGPLINSSVNFDYYYEIWKYGGMYSISEKDGVLLSRIME